MDKLDLAYWVLGIYVVVFILDLITAGAAPFRYYITQSDRMGQYRFCSSTVYLNKKWHRDRSSTFDEDYLTTHYAEVWFSVIITLVALAAVISCIMDESGPLFNHLSATIYISVSLFRLKQLASILETMSQFKKHLLQGEGEMASVVLNHVTYYVLKVKRIPRFICPTPIAYALAIFLIYYLTGLLYK